MLDIGNGTMNGTDQQTSQERWDGRQPPIESWIQDLRRLSETQDSAWSHIPRRMADSLEELCFETAAYERGVRAEGQRIRRELLAWLVGDSPEDAGIVAGRRIVDEIDRICPE